VAQASAPVEPAQTWRRFLTQETIVTVLVGLIVAVAVILPLITLFVSSFLVLDDMGFDTEWG
ncbi:uncharacterized protein METZ01_LOCUS330632, partial [marine metagenome]